MKINNIQFDCTIDDVINKLKYDCEQRGLSYLSSSKKVKGYTLVPCVYHSNGIENHPSAEFKDEDGFYYCFACKEAHPLPDVITHCLKENGWNWLRKNFLNQEVIERKVELDLSRKKNLKQNKRIEYVDKSKLDEYRFIHNYILDRGISEEIIKKFDIGYDPKNDCITFPNKDIDGNVLFIATRHTKKKRFNYPYGVKKPLYGLYEINREIKNGVKIDEIYITESMIDTLQLWSWGKYAVAMNGLGTLQQVKQLNCLPIRTIILATDNDAAGKQSREFLRKNIKHKIIKQISYKSYGECKDINDMTEEQFNNAKIIW